MARTANIYIFNFARKQITSYGEQVISNSEQIINFVMSSNIYPLKVIAEWSGVIITFTFYW